MHLKGSEIKEVFPGFSQETSVLKLLIEGLERNGNKVAQIEDVTGKSCTFANILQQSKSIAVGLCRAGIAPGDFVVLCCVKSSLAFAILLAVMYTGATPVLIDVIHANGIKKFINDHVIKAVFCDKTHLNSLNESLSQMNSKPTLIATTDVNDTTMKLLLLPNDEFLLFEVKDNTKNVVLVLFTSGSTSDPKGVLISDLGLQRLGYSFVDESIESYLLISAFAWISCTISFVSSIFKGYSLILSEEKDPASQMKLIEKYSIDGWTIYGGNINFYAKEPSLPSLNLSSLKVVNVGGAVVKKRMTKSFVFEVLKGKVGIQVLYGMTEVGLITTWRNKDLLDLSKADSSGYLAPGVEVKITDEQGRLVEPGNIGELRVRSLSMMVGYWDRPDLDALLFDSEGFFRSGDAGYFDNDGFLYIDGRANEVVTHGGSKVSVMEVEDLLKSHPGVLDAAVVARSHPSNVPDLIAIIVVRPGCHIREEDISVFITEQVGEALQLKAVHVVETIPRTTNGKVHKELLHNIVDKLHTTLH